VLAAFGVERILRGRSRTQATAIAAALAVGSWVELAAIPLPLTTTPIPAVYDTLARLSRGAVVEFPFFGDRQIYHHHNLYMFYSTRHWQPLINGYSDYIPPDFRRLAAKLASFPDAESIAMLRAREARYVVVHRSMLPEPQRDAFLLALGTNPALRLIARDTDILVYELLRGD
jgi:hypothetical protein